MELLWVHTAFLFYMTFYVNCLSLARILMPLFLKVKVSFIHGLLINRIMGCSCSHALELDIGLDSLSLYHEIIGKKKKKKESVSPFQLSVELRVN